MWSVFSELLNAGGADKINGESNLLTEDNIKSPGGDNKTAKLLKNACELYFERMHHLITVIWEQEVLPKDWNTAFIIPIHKK